MLSYTIRQAPFSDYIHIVLVNVFVLPTFTDGCKIMLDGYAICSSTYKLHLRLELAEHYIATLYYILGPRGLEKQFELFFVSQN